MNGRFRAPNAALRTATMGSSEDDLLLSPTLFGGWVPPVWDPALPLIEAALLADVVATIVSLKATSADGEM